MYKLPWDRAGYAAISGQSTLSLVVTACLISIKLDSKFVALLRPMSPEPSTKMTGANCSQRREEKRREEKRRDETRREEKRREEKRREEKRREEKRREESNTTNLATVTNLLQIAAWNFPRAPGATIRTTFYSWCSLTNNTHLHIHKSLSCTFLLSASRLVADWCKKHLECPVRLRLRGSDRTETTESVTTKCQEKFGSVFLSHQLHAVVKTQDWQCSALVSFKQHPADTLWRRKTRQGPFRSQKSRSLFVMGFLSTTSHQGITANDSLQVGGYIKAKKMTHLSGWGKQDKNIQASIIM